METDQLCNSSVVHPGTNQEIEHGCGPFNINPGILVCSFEFSYTAYLFPLFTMSPSKNTVYTHNNRASKVSVSKIRVL